MNEGIFIFYMSSKRQKINYLTVSPEKFNDFRIEKSKILCKLDVYTGDLNKKLYMILPESYYNIMFNYLKF